MFHVNKRIAGNKAFIGIFYNTQLLCEIDLKEKGKEMVAIDVYDGFRELVVGWTDIIEDIDGTS